MLELRDVHAGYAGHDVLRGVSLSVPDRTVVALLGPNGAGKTTLLRVASGLLAPTSGSVVVDGTDMTRARPSELAHQGVCHIPEGRGVFPALSVWDNLRLQATDGEGSIDRALQAFPRFRERRQQTAGTLSGGEQQMLALSRAYVAHPTTILLDEVSMGLAPSIVDQIFEHLSRITTDGAALLLVEQYVTRALALADIVYVLNQGRIVFAGEPGELDDDALIASYLGEGVA